MSTAIDIFDSIRNLIKIDKISIDNNVCRLHYKATVLILFTFSLLVTCRQYFGDPIDCIQPDDIPSNIIDTYCWIHSTYTLPHSYNKSIGREVPHPGVDKYTPGQQRTYHRYYQWVCFVLFLQALMFYVPRYLWKMWEGERLRSLVLNLNLPIMETEKKTEQITLLADYLKANLSYHNVYFYSFMVCEFLNFFNVIAQMYIVDSFLGGTFSTYGLDVIKHTEIDPELRVDPMIRIFPRMTKCTFHRYGSSGDVQKHDALCILPLNIINEKIYIFLWFWFIFLAICSGVVLVYRAALIFFPDLRSRALKIRARFTDNFHISVVLDNAKIGDWFLIYLLAKNIDPTHFRILMRELVAKIEGASSKHLLKASKQHDVFNGDSSFTA